MTVDVTALNDAPTITAVTTNDFTEDSTSAGDIVAVFNISDNETSVSNLSLTISNTNYYTITNNNDGTATVTLTTLALIMLILEMIYLVNCNFNR